MSSPVDEVSNLLGALALFISGEIREAVTGPAGSGGTLAEALIVIKDEPGGTLDTLHRVLGISQPGTAHLVRRLVELGWVAKRPGSDARSVALHLTPAGRRVADRILQARHQALAEIVGLLTARQRDQLAGIARKLLRPQARDRRDLARLCRLCDRSCCAECPVHMGYRDHAERPGYQRRRRRDGRTQV
jgi:DNA-binding MarR family transcriptional regulator